jgi:hypothetical protein
MKTSICNNYDPSREKAYNNNKVARGWQTTEVPWDKTHIINLTTQAGISANEFKDGRRLKDSWIATHFLMLDLDGGHFTAD